MMVSKLSNLISSTIVSWFAWIGVAIGALSAISAIIHIFDLGLPSFLADIIETYRKIVSPLYELVEFVGLQMPDAYVDIFVLYVVLLAMSVRAALIPLLDTEFFESELRKTAKYKTVVFDGPFDPESFPSNTASARQLGGVLELTLQQNPLRSQIWLKWLLLALILWPVLTLLPVRRIRHPNLIFLRETPNAWGTTVADETGETTYSNLFIRFEKQNFVRLVQMIMLPIAVVLFLSLATFNPL